MSMNDPSPGEKPRASGEALRRDIDENLKRVYQATLEEEVPDRFKQLLAQLKAQGAGQ